MLHRLLLINPAHLIAGRRHRGFAQFSVPSLSLGYVAALTPPTWTIRIIDESVRMEDGTDWNPDLVGISCLTQNAPRAYSLAADYRARGIPVILGGVHPSAVPEEAGQHADCVVVGEAESVWGKVLNDLERGDLSARYQGGFPSLEGLPIPRRDLYPPGYFVETLITSKGCPNACDFCSVWRFYGRRYRTRPIDEVVDELDSLPPGKIILIADDNLTIDHRRTIALCRRMVERGIRRRLAIQASLGVADNPELLLWLRRSGCLFVVMGLESLNTESLRRIGKPDLLRAGVRGYEERIARVHAHGMAVVGCFIVGLDEDTVATFERVRRFTLAAKIDCSLIQILHPMPGTLVWERMCRQGRLLYTDLPDDYALYNYDNVAFQPARMTAVQLQEGTRNLIASLSRLPVSLKRMLTTWRSTRNPLGALSAFVWNWRTLRALRTYPLKDVRTARP
jgi:radical SAM superfamily enzyme YgiQ (UPF0313 family)